MEFDKVQDSGERREFSTGSVRDRAEGKGRYDLIPPYPLFRLALHYENGAKKYGVRNWEKGQPLHDYIDSGIRHAFKVLANKTDEDHASAVVWNFFGYIFTKKMIEDGFLPRELDTLGHCEFPEDPKTITSSSRHISALDDPLHAESIEEPEPRIPTDETME
jgi:hypothetical protein